MADSDKLLTVSGTVKVQQAGDADQEGCPRQDRGDDKPDYQRQITRGQWALVFLTAAYVAVSFCTLRAIRNQAAQTEKAFTISQRPWVVTRKIADRPQVAAGKPVIIDLAIKNAGDSVAKNTVMYVAVDTDAIKGSEFTTPQFQGAPKVIGLVAPRGTAKAKVAISASPPFSQDQIDNWNRPDCPTTFRVFAYFRYLSEWSDIDGAHGTTICFEYDPNTPELFDICGSDGW